MDIIMIGGTDDGVCIESKKVLTFPARISIAIISINMKID